MYSNISQILLLYKTWRYYNQFDSPKSLGVCYWCVKTPQCGYIDHDLKHISFYVQKRVVAMGVCYNPALVRGKLLGLPASVKWVYSTVSAVAIVGYNVFENHTFKIYMPHITGNNELTIKCQFDPMLVSSHFWNCFLYQQIIMSPCCIYKIYC